MRSLQLMLAVMFSLLLFQSCQKDNKEQMVDQNQLDHAEIDESQPELFELTKTGEENSEKQLEGSGILATMGFTPERTASKARSGGPQVLSLLIQPLTCGATISGRNTGTSYIGGTTYQEGCLNNYWSFSAPEELYPFTLENADEVTFSLYGLSADLDLFVFTLDNRGNLGQCIGYSINGDNRSESLTLNLWRGEYVVIVDGYRSNQISNFTLSASCLNDENGTQCEGFENYYTGSLTNQTSNWVDWNSNPNFTGQISTYRAANGRKSLYIDFKGGYSDYHQPDVVRQVGERSTGAYKMSWQMYIPSGRNAHVNFQKFQQLGREWGLGIFFRMGRRIAVKARNRVIQTNVYYPQGRWFDVSITYDLDRQYAFLWVDGKMVACWKTYIRMNKSYNGQNRLAGVDFYAYHSASTFYIDEFCFEEEDASTIQYFTTDDIPEDVIVID